MFILQNHHTALVAASYQGHSAVVKKLLEAGANPDIQDNVCYTLCSFVLVWNCKKLTLPIDKFSHILWVELKQLHLWRLSDTNRSLEKNSYISTECPSGHQCDLITRAFSENTGKIIFQTDKLLHLCMSQVRSHWKSISDLPWMAVLTHFQFVNA